jgi:ABC-type transporter Mla subunit MlaD
MAKNRDALRAGIFMVLSVAAIFAIIIGIVGWSEFSTASTTQTISFKLTDNVGGLRKGDDVRLGGLKIGKVEKIDFMSKGANGQGDPAIVVVISVPEDDKLTHDATIKVETTVTGLTCLNITSLGNGTALGPDEPLYGKPDALSTAMADLPAITGLVKTDLSDVDNWLGPSTGDFKHTMSNIQDITAVGRAKLPEITGKLSTDLSDVHHWLGPTTGDFQQTMDNIAVITSHAREKLPPLTESVQKMINNINTILDKTKGAMGDIVATISHAKGLSAGAESWFVSNRGRLDEIVENVNKTGVNLDAAVVEIRHSPWRLFYKPSADEYANLNLYDTARQFAEGAQSMSDAAVALRDSLKDPQADPGKVQKLYNDLNDQFQKFNQAEDDLWKQIHE